MEHEAIKDLIAPYVLGAVSPEEMVVVRAHIMSCEECIAEADSYAKAAGSLALAVEDRPVPAGFADAVLGNVRELRPSDAIARTRNLLPAFGVAALVAVIAVLSFALVDARSELTDNRRIVSALVRGEGVVDLEGGGAAATVLPTDDGSLFVAAGLERAPEGKTYQLWFMDDGVPTSAGVFDPDDEGIAIFRSPLGYTGFNAAAVTIEIAGGVDQPTSDPIMAGSA